MCQEYIYAAWRNVYLYENVKNTIKALALERWDQTLFI